MEVLGNVQDLKYCLHVCTAAGWAEPGWHLIHNRIVGELYVRLTLFCYAFLCSAMMLTKTEMLHVIHKWGGQGSHTHATIVLSPWHWPDTLSLDTCLFVRLSFHQISLLMGPRSEVTTSYGDASHTQCHIHNEGLTGCVSARVVTLHVKMCWLLWHYTPLQESVCV